MWEKIGSSLISTNTTGVVGCGALIARVGVLHVVAFAPSKSGKTDEELLNFCLMYIK